MQVKINANRTSQKIQALRAHSADPQVLRDLLSQARGTSLSVRRITSDEVKALRVTQRKENKCAVTIVRTFADLASAITESVASIFHRPEKKKTQCDFYGHVHTTGSWDGPYPTCIHCQTLITSVGMLRGATIRG